MEWENTIQLRTQFSRGTRLYYFAYAGYFHCSSAKKVIISNFKKVGDYVKLMADLGEV